MTGGHEAELIAAASTGDQAAWNQLVQRYTRLVWHVIHGFSTLPHDQRSDVHQTVWLRLAEKMDTIRDPSRVGSWLATTARNECIRQLRTMGRDVLDPDAARDLASDQAPAVQLLLDTERDAALWSAFAELRVGCQQLLRLLIADPPFTYDEIAEILDMPRGSIGPTRQRCLDQLRSAFERHADHDRS